MHEPHNQVGGVPHWERQVLEKLVQSVLKEQRAARRWGIFFKLFFLGYALFLLGAFMLAASGAGDAAKLGPHTAVIDLSGIITQDSRASASVINQGLKDAFEDKNTKGVIIRINSPGGSPVQAGQINDEIRRQRKLHPNIPIYTVIEDLCASGGYYVAAATDKIYVDKASLVGSIGVLMDGFGFTGTMEKLGVERRLITAGENKGFLDPFSPANEGQQAYAREMIGEVHQQFIKVVRDGRGKRLKESPEIFSGLIWSGERSIQLGLADGLGSMDSVARDVIKAEKLVDFTPKENFADRLAKRFGAAAGASLSQSFSTRMR